MNCTWSTWTVGSCSKTCGGGMSTKTRNKTIEEAHGGTCDGESSENETCNTNSCPGKSILVAL